MLPPPHTHTPSPPHTLLHSPAHTSPTLSPLSTSLLSNSTSTSPPLLFHFHRSPPEPDRQTLRDYGIITLFPRRLELLPELTLTVWSAPTHRDHSGPGDSHRCWWSHVWKQRQAHLLHPAGGALLLCGAKDRYEPLITTQAFTVSLHPICYSSSVERNLLATTDFCYHEDTLEIQLCRNNV